MEWAGGEVYAELFYGGTLASFGRLGAGLATDMNDQQWVARAHETLGRIYQALLSPEQVLAKLGLSSRSQIALWACGKG